MLCVCASIRPIATRTRVLILQHPQEPDKELGSARLAHLCLPTSMLKIGLSWRNLSAALGEQVDTKRWGVLFLGSARKPAGPRNGDRLFAVNKKGEPSPRSEEIVNALEGIIILDGTWSQAKALWWRNAWLLKVHRLVLDPADRSLYMKLRREPRNECLSTIEAVAAALGVMEPEGFSKESLLDPFKNLLDAYRSKQRRGSGARGTPIPEIESSALTPS